jgi:hypothetical protein
MSSQATSGVISVELLEKYRATLQNNYTVTTGGGIKPAQPAEWALVHLLHSKGGSAATPFAWGEEYQRANADVFPIVAGVAPEVVQMISREFVYMQSALEEGCQKRASVTKEPIIEAFSAFYHILSPTTEANRYLRSLIEKTFEVLELGAITPAKFTAIIQKSDGPAPSEGKTSNER